MSETFIYELNIHPVVIILGAIIFITLLGWWDYNYVLPQEYEFVNKQNDLKKDIEEVKEMIKHGL